ncbi:UDP-N-acetylmuramoyl-tripeptide--D-alanyl-D-alanine ligase [Enterococcus sp. LJL99]
MKLTMTEVAQAVNAVNKERQWADLEITGIEFDSRLIKEGNLFVPLSGTNDGHSFIDGAIKKGAIAAFWQADKEAPADFPVIKVLDTLKAMQDLAVYFLNKIQPTVIGITGSNGKTTTKDMTEAVLAQKYHTYKTQGNYNNNIGLPYTILHMPDTTEKLILEMGMDHADEIAFLSKLAKPQIAAITMIGEAHIENLGSRKGIAAAKMEIAEGLAPNGLLVLPNEEPLLKSYRSNLSQEVKTVGWLSDADYQAEIILEEKERTEFKINNLPEIFSIPVLGKYNVGNALIAIAIGQKLAVPIEEIQKGLANFKLTKNRTEWISIANNIDILSDVYNANPTAMKLVLDSFSKMKTTGKKMAVLGDMLELGPDSKKMHEEIGNHLEPSEIAEVFLYGTEMNHLFIKLKEKYPENQVHYFSENSKSSLIEALEKHLETNDMIVLKASNGMGLSEIVTHLIDEK